MRLAVIKRRFEELRRQAYWDIAPLPKMQKTTCIYVGPGKYADWRDHSPISSGEVWADPGETAFLEFSGDFSESNHWFDISLGGEACLFVDGVPYAGLDENHRLVPIPEGYHQFKIEAFNNKTVPQKLARAHIVSIDWDLDNLTNIALQAVKLGEAQAPRSLMCPHRRGFRGRSDTSFGALGQSTRPSKFGSSRFGNAR